MTIERLREMIAIGETLDTEFKGESHSALSDDALVENVVCLANRPGDRPGWLLTGLEGSCTLTEARPRHEAGVTDLHRLQALIANRTRPSLACRAYQVVLDEGPVLEIEVPPARAPVGTSSGLYVRRAIGGRGVPECLPFHFHEMQSRQANSGLLDRLRRQGELTVAAAALVTQRSPDEAHESLHGLLAAGLVAARGTGTRRAWRRSVSAARRLGLPPGDALQEGAGQLTAEGAVLQHVAEHGRITRREVATLCQLLSDQAKRLLARLVGLGNLQAHGQGKARSYGAPPGNTGPPTTDPGAP